MLNNTTHLKRGTNACYQLTLISKQDAKRITCQLDRLREGIEKYSSNGGVFHPRKSASFRLPQRGRNAQTDPLLNKHNSTGLVTPHSCLISVFANLSPWGCVSLWPTWGVANKHLPLHYTNLNNFCITTCLLSPCVRSGNT